MKNFNVWTISHLISHLAAANWCSCPEIVASVRYELGSFYLQRQCHQHCCYSTSGLLLSMPEDFVLVSLCSRRLHDFNSSFITTDPASSLCRRSDYRGGCDLRKCGGSGCRSETGMSQPLPLGIRWGVHTTSRRLDHFPSGTAIGTLERHRLLIHRERKRQIHPCEYRGILL